MFSENSINLMNLMNHLPESLNELKLKVFKMKEKID